MPFSFLSLTSEFKSDMQQTFIRYTRRRNERNDFRSEVEIFKVLAFLVKWYAGKFNIYSMGFLTRTLFDRGGRGNGKLFLGKSSVGFS